MKTLFCPVCGNTIENFLPLPDFYRTQAEKYGFKHFGRSETLNIKQYSCPTCGATDRERLCALWMKRSRTALFSESKLRMLHFAPEAALSSFVRTFPEIDYRSCDISGIGVDDRVDITHMPYPDSSFDFFICSHVLEHVSDDRAALRELYRTIKAGGFGILLAPIPRDITETIEENEELPPAERWKLFGQDDHRRLYAKSGFIKRIKDCGFFVYEWKEPHFGQRALEENGLSQTSTLYIAAKPGFSQSQPDLNIITILNRLHREHRIEQANPANPLVSIGIPAYNPKFYEEALRSATQQDYPNIEIVVCDDSPDDQISRLTKKIQAEIPSRLIRYYKNASRLEGMMNLQRCLDLAEGKYIKFLNDDDVLMPTCVSRMVDVMEHDNGVSLVTSHRDLIDKDGKFIPERIHNVSPFGFDTRVSGQGLINFFYSHVINFVGEPSSVLFRATDIKPIKPTINSISGIPIRVINDIASFCNVLANGDLVYLTDTLSKFRIHSQQRQAQSDIPAMAQESFKNFRLTLAREKRSPENWAGTTQCTPWPDTGTPQEIDLMKALGRALEMRTRGSHLSRLIAFHLPQFHSIPENDAWWGKGFTEWDNVKQGKPLFEGHYQPHEPGELGYYDLSDAATLEKQAKLARLYGLEGFCFYHYWFNGKRLLEKPVDMLLAHPEIDLPFCLCWANENWTRRWDGGEQEILIAQTYDPEGHERFAHDLLPYLRDPRYIRINGKPLILIYRADIVPKLADTVAAWRAIWHKMGIGEVYLVCVESFTARIPQNDGFDAACEFFPHQINFSRLAPDTSIKHPDSLANIADYSKLTKEIESRAHPGYKRFHGVIPSWDNSARRRKGGASLFINSTPERYESWLNSAIRQTLIDFDGDERLVFINAWNEWGEGCHLEPDTKYGRAWLEATARAQQSAQEIDVHYERNVRPYHEWLSNHEPDEKQLARLAAKGKNEILFIVAVDATHSTPDQLSATLKSFAEQQYSEIQLVVVANLPPPAQNPQGILWLESPDFPDVLLIEFAKLNPESWLCQIRAGDLFSRSGMSLLASALQSQEEVVMTYADEDTLDSRYGPTNPQFRPDFDIDYLRNHPYIGRFILIRGRQILETGGPDSNYGLAAPYDLVLRFFERYGKERIFHLPEILFHGLPESVDSKTQLQHQKALFNHLERSGIDAQVSTGQYPGSFSIQYRHNSTPLVSIIIPTKDKIEQLQRCLESLLEKTSYKNYEVLIVDNQSTAASAVQYLKGLRDLNVPNIRILDYPHSFNFSAINNLAAREARGEYLVLLNNDTAIIQSDWLEALLNHAQRHEVGIVGAKLLYPNGTIQHAGVILGLRGPADHSFMGEAMDAPGYFGRLLLDQQYSAVTAACLMIRKSIYQEVGGMDEEKFKVSYNDVDLCLKVRKTGYSVVWTAHAIVMHEGNVSQRLVLNDSEDEKRSRFESEQKSMYRIWLKELAADPAYNRNLSLSGNGFELEMDPLLCRFSENTRPRVLAHPGDEQGSGCYRIIDPLRALISSGFTDGDLRPHFFDPIHLAKLLPDVIVLQRQHLDAQISNIDSYREFCSARLVYDIDDNLAALPRTNPNWGKFPEDILERLRKVAKLCDRITVSTEPLKRTLANLHPDIVVLPNYLPPAHWGEIVRRPCAQRSGKPRIGWAGGLSHVADLNVIGAVVRALADKVDWVFFGMKPEGIDSCIAEYHPGVAIDLYPNRLASLNLDLALAPLEANLFNECKSNLRLLEYGACGYPVIASDIESYRCGLPVTLVKNDPQEWIAAIEAKLADRGALRDEGLALQMAVRERWMLEGENLALWQRGWFLDNEHIQSNLSTPTSGNKR